MSAGFAAFGHVSDSETSQKRLRPKHGQRRNGTTLRSHSSTITLLSTLPTLFIFSVVHYNLSNDCNVMKCDYRCDLIATDLIFGIIYGIASEATSAFSQATFAAWLCLT